MILRKAIKLGIPHINVVRDQEEYDVCKSYGAEHVINFNDPEFRHILKNLTKSWKSGVAFESIAGNMTGDVMASLPSDSTVYLYGSLSLKRVGSISPIDIIFKRKKLEGFHLFRTFLPTCKVSDFTSEVHEDIANGIIQPQFVKEITLDELEQNVIDYETDKIHGKFLMNIGSC